jgi:hypothetical protein
MVKIRSVDSVQLNTSISKLMGNMILKVCGNMYAFVPKNLKKIVIRTVGFTSRQMITARSIPAIGERI